jgi:hypothetical protein
LNFLLHTSLKQKRLFSRLKRRVVLDIDRAHLSGLPGGIGTVPALRGLPRVQWAVPSLAHDENMLLYAASYHIRLGASSQDDVDRNAAASGLMLPYRAGFGSAVSAEKQPQRQNHQADREQDRANVDQRSCALWISGLGGERAYCKPQWNQNRRGGESNPNCP